MTPLDPGAPTKTSNVDPALSVRAPTSNASVSTPPVPGYTRLPLFTVTAPVTEPLPRSVAELLTVTVPVELVPFKYKCPLLTTTAPKLFVPLSVCDNRDPN